MDDILVGQATSGFALSRVENLEGGHKVGSTRPGMEVGGQQGVQGKQLPDGVSNHALGFAIKTIYTL